MLQLAIIAQAIHLGVKCIPCLCESERLVHYRSKVQLLEDALDFMIELYAIEKMKTFKAPLIKPISS